ncbi:RNA 2',3'-cyclic phosphodiesterase [Thermodesulfobacterium hydrogeniphilum]|uniref:RNA 2',3'-cyclic phosphodiesterase n=1 Tax=Thermodesulfobacterium hydrogeniphilum TaxID=161156 RepID=UPI000690227C|nr:RNA 2',3'-cyclic phosphodiesterase [Thermodesulfobacterium hydrogeniphilum]
MVRAFLAIDLPEELKKKLYELSKIEPPEGLKIKWVERPNFHITLKFFGSISEKLLEKIFKASEKALKEESSFKLVIDKIGYFPEKGNPRVVWIGLKLENDQLLNIHKILEKIFKKMKISDRKEKFHPHITLFRVKKLSDKEDFNAYLKNLAKESQILEGFNFIVKELTIFKSNLTPQGPIYESLYKIKIGHGI